MRDHTDFNSENLPHWGEFDSFQPHRFNRVHHKNGGEKQTTTTTQQMSPEQRQIYNRLLGLAEEVPVQGTFTGQRVAEQSPYTLQSQQAALGTIPGIEQSVGQQQAAVTGLLGGGPGGTALPGYTNLPASTDLVSQFGVQPGQGLLSQFGVTPAALPGMQGIQGVEAVGQDLSRALSAPILEQLNESTLPGISSSAGQAGAYGGARQQILEGQAREQASQDITDTLLRASLQQQEAQAGQTLAQNQQALQAQQQGFGQQLGAAQFGAGLQGQEFGQALGAGQFGAGLQGQQFGQSLALQGQTAEQQLAQQNQQLQGILGGLGYAGGVNQQSLVPSSIYGQVGAQEQGYQQALIDAQMAQFNEAEQAKINQILQQAGILGSAPYSQGTTTQTTKTSGGGGSTLQNVIGGGLSGWGATGNPWGAGLGALAGLL